MPRIGLHLRELSPNQRIFHRERMQALHPDWSGRQLDCCLYWQAGARKALRAEIGRWLAELPLGGGLRIVHTPEATGVNLTETMRSAGIALEWPPDRLAYQIVLAGMPANNEQPTPKDQA